jgi:hypothetical protein
MRLQLVLAAITAAGRTFGVRMCRSADSKLICDACILLHLHLVMQLPVC